MTITEFVQDEVADTIEMQFSGMVAGSIHFEGDFEIDGRSLTAICSFSMNKDTFNRVKLFGVPTLRELARAEFDVTIIEKDGARVVKEI